MKQKTGCMVCGAPLVYGHPQERECAYCRKTFESGAACEAGHFVCDRCHGLGAFELIRDSCVSSTLRDPLKLAVSLMRHPAVKMHGPEHHFLVPAVLLAAYYNAKGNFQLKEGTIREAERRASKVPGGFCGFYGDCGAAVGTGIFMSIVTGTTPLSTKTWQLSNMLTARSLMSIARNGGPRCCKRNTYLAITEAAGFISENLGVSLEIDPHIACEFTGLNKECRRKECRFYAGR